MSFRNQVIASSALLFISLGGVSSLVNAADTNPVVRETCTREKFAVRFDGHPGKKILVPVRQGTETVECAKSPRKVLVLASFTDAAGGESLVRGNTERDMEQVYAQKATTSPNVLTNRCVAHTVQRQWTDARSACDAAVEGALRKRGAAFGHTGFNPADREVSAAYSNRAVLNWLLNDEAAAQNDLAKARGFDPRAGYVQRNWEAADRQPSLAGNRSPAG